MILLYNIFNVDIDGILCLYQIYFKVLMKTIKLSLSFINEITEDGIIISFNDLQSLKGLSPIAFIEEGINISISNEQNLKFK